MTSRNITRYVRYTANGSRATLGLLEGNRIRELRGGLFSNPKPTGKTVRVSDVKLLIPEDPHRIGKVIGVPGNYNRPDDPPRHVAHPRWFAKLPSSLIPHEGNVELPPEAANLNYEGEIVVVISKKGRFISLKDAPSYVFGLTIGLDWSENTWFGERNTTGGPGPQQPGERRALLEPSKLIAKGMDTWGGLYHTIVCGLDWHDLRTEIRLNEEVVAYGRSRDMTNTVEELICYISHFVTLWPGDLLYCGTPAPPSLPGARRQMRHGDIVDVEIEGIGTLRNHIVALDRKIPEIGYNTRAKVTAK